jgi:hypothetical protein
MIMARYSIKDSTLDFVDSYKKLQIVQGTPAVEVGSFDLQMPGRSVALSIVDGYYVVDYADDFATATNKLDVGNGATLTFHAEEMRMGGIGIVDLRDMREGWGIKAKYSYVLGCSTFHFKYVPGFMALQLQFLGRQCVQWSEIMEEE